MGGGALRLPSKWNATALVQRLRSSEEPILDAATGSNCFQLICRRSFRCKIRLDGDRSTPDLPEQNSGMERATLTFFELLY